MAHAINKPFELVQVLSSGGTPVTGLTNASFPLGTVQIRRIEPSGPSPAAVQLTGGVEFEVEELYAGKGIYALKFDAQIATSAGAWSIKIEAGPGAIDILSGVMVFVDHDIEDELAWLAGKNVVGISQGWDDEGNATQVLLYGFDSAAEADLFVDDPVGNASLVRWHMQKDRIFRAEDGYLQKFVSKVV